MGFKLLGRDTFKENYDFYLFNCNIGRDNFLSLVFGSDGLKYLSILQDEVFFVDEGSFSSGFINGMGFTNWEAGKMMFCSR